MFWAGIWREGRTSLIAMERDNRAPKKGYSAWSYQKALEEGLLPHYDGWQLFQHDNASIHTAGSTSMWLLLRGIALIDWPPYSPDLNPIENIWAMLKRRLRRDFPHLHDLKDNEADRAEFIRCITIAWAAIPQAQITRVIDSLERRLKAVIKVRGWYTKY